MARQHSRLSLCQYPRSSFQPYSLVCSGTLALEASVAVISVSHHTEEEEGHVVMDTSHSRRLPYHQCEPPL